MAEIIPSINVRTFEEVQERIRKVEPFVEWCHLDVTDGIFSKHLTWHDPRDLLNLETSLNVEVHLMVSEPEKILDQWLARPVRSKMPKASADSLANQTSNGVNPVKRIVVHLEAVSDMELIIEKCHEAGIEIGLAINPETLWGRLELWLGKVDIYEILAVHPGPSGQEVDWPEMLGKIGHIRKRCPECIIEIDGGINPETAKKVVEAGANLLVAGAYIFESPSVSEAIGSLKNVSSSRR